jgi:outer membrane protein OmpA-like peptidoglycan-associated protein
MKNKGSNFFWPSYADLMTSLFFIMLVLYVLTFVKLRLQQQATEEQLQKIKEIQAAVQELPEEYFTYQPEHKRFILNQQIRFDMKESDIKELDKAYLLNVGQSIVSLVDRLKSKYQDQNIKYLIVIEGMASNYPYSRNFPLSYERALSLFHLWKINGIEFDPTICEVQIAGSGTGGVGRFSGAEEYKNQQFLIQVVPKIGEIEL